MNPNEPAFPRAASEYTASGTCHSGNDAKEAQSGMDLRTYIATQVLAAKVACPGGEFDHLNDARFACEYADALIQELNKKP